jgi:FkbM family methyltransferase
MRPDHKIGILLELPGCEYDAATAPFRDQIERFVAAMSNAIEEKSPLSRTPGFKDYAVYCRWPIRQLEYSFAITHLPAEADGCALDIGSGVKPFPYLLDARGWPVTSIDLEVEQVAAMRLHGQDAFGGQVDHRVADSRGMGFPDGRFRVITCISVLEHLKHADVPIALGEIVRVCQPGGRIIITLDIFPADHVHPIPGESAFSADALEQIFRPIATACGTDNELTSALTALRRTRSEEFEAFWLQHWQPGLWHPKNRGYGAFGLVFDLPEDPAACRALATQLKATAREMDFFPPADLHQEQTLEGEKLWMAGDSVFTRMLARDDFERDVHHFFEHYLRAGDIAFDVGASVGLYTLLFSRIVGPTGEVHAFEPTANTFDCLVRNTLSAGQHVRLNRFGLSHENAALRLSHGAQDNNAFNTFGQPFGPAESRDGLYQSEMVWAATLDDYLRDYEVGNVDLVKIDVEGWEERVVRGGIATLLQSAPVLVLEYCSPAARNANSSCAALSHLLNALGYDLFRYKPNSRDLDPVDRDRGAWQYANLVAVQRKALPAVISRLKGQGPAESTVEVKPNLAGPTLAYGASDRLLLLEENRSLRQRLMAKILDAEVTSLVCQLHTSEADRAARLKVIEALQDQLQASQADRAARLREIEHLQGKLQASEADRAARLREIEHLQGKLQASEADRAARLREIEHLQGKLQASEADRAALGKQLDDCAATIRTMQASLGWRITTPLRRLYKSRQRR